MLMVVDDLVSNEVIDYWKDENGQLVDDIHCAQNISLGSKGKAQNLVNYLFSQLESHSLVESSKTVLSTKGHLTFLGWSKFNDLKNQGSDERLAFMAMQFSGESFDTIYETCIKPAVKKTGFDLVNVIEDQKQA